MSVAAKTATSSGCNKCFELAGRQTNIMRRLSAVSTISAEICDEHPPNDEILEAGWHDLKAYIVGLIDKPTSVRLSGVTPTQRSANIQLTVDVAKEIDTLIVLAFVNSPAESGLTLDDGLDELVKKVAATNLNTVVVLDNAEPVLMQWLGEVAAVLEMLYPGQEGGWATADLLLDNSVPQDHLLLTYPAILDSTMTRNPNFPERVATDSDNAMFNEGLNNGYSWYVHTNTSVLFPFGYCEHQQPLLASWTPSRSSGTCSFWL